MYVLALQLQWPGPRRRFCNPDIVKLERQTPEVHTPIYFQARVYVVNAENFVERTISGERHWGLVDRGTSVACLL
jgi:hypothetical protein